MKTEPGEREITADDAATSDASAAAATTRREFTRGLLGAGVLGLFGGGIACAPPDEDDIEMSSQALTDAATVDFVVVGSGPGGGPLAANLARAGYTVALLEAGLDPLSAEAKALDPFVDAFYQVPAFLSVAAEHPLLSWDFYVKHYSDPARQERDSKYVPGKGILYPRGSALGGSAAHNALIFTYPHDEDFDLIARTTGDTSWESKKMRKYFQRLERCEYLQPGAPGHGFSGYVNTNMFDEQAFNVSPAIRDLASAGATQPASATQGNPTRDVNHPAVAKGDTGAFRTPMHVATKVRVSVGEYLRATQQLHPDRLFLVTGALATKVLFQNRRACGVEYAVGHNLYGADKNYDPTETGPVQVVRARREVIVAGGAFNTPQLLKLSGVGPAAELRRHGIPVVADVPGVGQNLQDRYEVSVVVELNKDDELYSRCAPFQPVDPCWTAYDSGQWDPPQPQPFFGPYANNAVYGTRIEKSKPQVALPDLFMLGFAVPFRGYFPGFSQFALGRSWTWLALRCHNVNTAGKVLLRSANPRETPDINFHHFDEGNDRAGTDLAALTTGVKRVRQYLSHANASQHILREVLPGPAVQTDAQIQEYIKNEAWGHHASCSAKIGSSRDSQAVLDSAFRVRGVMGLRVVDASVFPKIPGFFPVAAVLMISEKASDVIISEARATSTVATTAPATATI